MTRRFLLAATLLGACGDDEGNGKFPIVAGGGGTGNSFMVDASVSTGDTNSSQSARVCLLVDARSPTACAATGAGRLVLSLR